MAEIVHPTEFALTASDTTFTYRSKEGLWEGLVVEFEANVIEASPAEPVGPGIDMGVVGISGGAGGCVLMSWDAVAELHRWLGDRLSEKKQASV